MGNSEKQSPGRYSLFPPPAKEDGTVSGVSKRRGAVSASVAAAMGRGSDKGGLPAAERTSGPGCESRPPDFASIFMGAYSELRALCHDRIAFISRYRTLREAGDGFMEEFTRWLGGRELNIHMPSLPEEACRGWRMATGSEALLTEACPRICLKKGLKTITVELIDVLKATR